VRENATAALGLAHVDAPELRPGDTVNPVEARQTLVEIGMLRIEDLEHARVIANQVLEEQLCFPPHRVAKAILELGELFLIRLHYVDILELQPLTGEIIHQSARPGIAQHPPHLRRQDGGLAKRRIH
jgi:hypothetical protein